MFQYWRQEVCPRDQAGVQRRGGAGAQADLRDGVQDRVDGGVFQLWWRWIARSQWRIWKLIMILCKLLLVVYRFLYLDIKI